MLALLSSVPWTLVLGTLIRYHVAFMMSTPLQNFFSAPRHTMRSPHYHHAPRSARIAISIRVTYLRGRRRDRYRQLENDLKKVCGKPSARKHGGRSYNIGANNGSKRGHAAAGTTIGRKRSGRRYDGRTGTDGGQKSPPLTRHQQAHTQASTASTRKEKTERHIVKNITIP